MSKRKNKKSTKPNLPETTLKRARAQARGDDYEPEDAAEEDVDEAPVAANNEDDADSGRSSSRRRSRRSSRSSRSSRRSAAPVQFSQRSSSGAAVDKAAIQNTLANPTKFVSEEELQEEYGYVVSDIRNMFLLAIGLMVLLVVLAQFI